MTSGASRLTAADLDGDGKADLIGRWSDGLWVKYSSSGKWQRLASSADWIATGKLKP